MDAANHAHQRIRAEYLEMPGLRLTGEQARRLCGVEQALCKQVLDTLVRSKFLSITPNGTYVGARDGVRTLSARPAKADLRTAPRITQAS